MKILETEKNAQDDRWIAHCICVGNSAGKIEQDLNEAGYNLYDLFPKIKENI